MSSNQLQTHSDKLSLFLYEKSYSLWSQMPQSHSCQEPVLSFKQSKMPGMFEEPWEKWQINPTAFLQHSSIIILFYDTDVISFALPSIVAVNSTLHMTGVQWALGWGEQVQVKWWRWRRNMEHLRTNNVQRFVPFVRTIIYLFGKDG